MVVSRQPLKLGLTSAPLIWLTLLIVTSVAAGLRIISLNTEPLWFDEALTLVISQWSLTNLWFMGVDPTPPLYYTFFKLVFGDSVPSVFSTRVLSVIFGVLTIPAFYGLASAIFGRTSGLFAATLLALSPIHIEYSQEARAYALAFLLVTLSAYCLAVVLAETESPAKTEPLTSNRIRLWLIGYVVAAAASSYAHTISIFWVAGSFLLLAFALHRTERSSRSLIVTTLALAALHTLWLWHVFLQVFERGGFSWLEQPAFTKAANTFINTVAPASIWRLEPFVQLSLALAIGIGILFGRLSQQHRALVTVFLVMPLAIWAAGFLKPLYLERTIIFVVLGGLLSLTAVFARIPKPAQIGFAVVLFLVFSKATYNHFVLLDKQDWGAASEALLENTSENDLVVLCRAASFPALKHQLGSRNVATYAGLYDGKLVPLPSKNAHTAEWLRQYFEDYYQPWTTGGRFQEIWTLEPFDEIFGVKAHCWERHQEPFDRIVGSPNSRKILFDGTGVSVVKTIP